MPLIDMNIMLTVNPFQIYLNVSRIVEIFMDVTDICGWIARRKERWQSYPRVPYPRYDRWKVRGLQAAKDGY